MGTPVSIPEMKSHIFDELERISLQNKLASIKVLDEKLSLLNLSPKSRKYIENHPEIKEHYIKIRNKLMERRYLELIIHSKTLHEKARYEEERKLLQEQFIFYFTHNMVEQTEKQRLQNIINHKEEECKRQLDLINTLMNNEKEKEKAEIEKEKEKFKTALLNHRQEIENANQEIKELKEKADQKNQELHDYMLAYEMELKQMKSENEKKLRENEEKFKKEFEAKYNEKIKKELDKKIKEAKDEMEAQQIKKEIELFNKKEKIGKMFDNEVNNIKAKKIKEIMYYLKKNEDKICKEEIIAYANKSSDNVSEENNFNDKKPHDNDIKAQKSENSRPILYLLTRDLSSTENMAKSALYHLGNFIKSCQQEIKNVEHLNIILVGPSGAGKTTLINALLKLNLQTGYGKPQTEKIEYHTSDAFPILRLADSRGIEKNKEADVEEISKSVEAFIQEQISKNDPDKFIHCIWYCFTGTRLEGSEIKVLEKMSEIYTNDKLPVIIVYTHSMSLGNIKKAKNYIYNELNLSNEFIEVLAQEDTTDTDEGDIIVKHPKNLDKLIEKSLEKSMQSINSSCFEGKLNEIKSKIKEKFDDIVVKLENNLERKVRNSLLNLNEKSDIQKFYELTKNMIFEIANCFFVLNGDIQFDNNKGYKVKLDDDLEYELSDASKIKVNLYVNDYFKYVIEALKKKVKIDIDVYTEELVKEIIDKQFEFNSRNQNLLEFNVTREKLTEIMKSFISSEIIEKLKFMVLKNSVKYLTNPLINFFSKHLILLYEEGMKQNSFIQNAKDSIKISFNELDKKIKEYYDKKIKKPIIKEEENEEINKENLDKYMRDDVKELYKNIE